MTTENKKILDLALQALADGKLDDRDRVAFARDHKRFANKELTFRELVESIRKPPTGDLKTALVEFYEKSQYTRPFK